MKGMPYEKALFLASGMASWIILQGGGKATEEEFLVMVGLLLKMHTQDKRQSPRQIMVHVSYPFLSMPGIAGAYRGETGQNYLQLQETIIMVAEQHLAWAEQSASEAAPSQAFKSAIMATHSSKQLKQVRSGRESRQSMLVDIAHNVAGMASQVAPLGQSRSTKTKKRFSTALQGAVKGIWKKIKWAKASTKRKAAKWERSLTKWIAKLKSVVLDNGGISRKGKEKLIKFAALLKAYKGGNAQQREQFFELVKRLKRKLGWKW
jgi:hypothetical protein